MSKQNPRIDLRRCVRCDKVLLTRRWYGKEKPVVICSCGVRYAVAAIKDSDPVRWNHIRKFRLFVEEKRPDQVVIYVEGGWGLHPKREKLKHA